MKKIFMTLALLVTLCNVSLGIAYACECFVDGKKVCSGQICEGDGSRCKCSDAPAET